MIDLGPVIRRETLMRTILLHTYPGEASRLRLYMLLR